MNANRLTFRAFTNAGENRLTAFPSLNVLRVQEHLVPVIDTIGKALAGQPACARLILSIEDTDPFGVEWAHWRKRVGVARLVSITGPHTG